MKRCSRCHAEKDYSEFGVSNHSHDGLQSYCIECMREYSRGRVGRRPADWVRKTSDLRDYQKKYRNTRLTRAAVEASDLMMAFPGKIRERYEKRQERRKNTCNIFSNDI